MRTTSMWISPNAPAATACASGKSASPAMRAGRYQCHGRARPLPGHEEKNRPGVAGDTASASLKIALGETRAAGLVRLTHGLLGRLLTPARFNAYIATNRKQSHAPPPHPRRHRPPDPGST